MGRPKLDLLVKTLLMNNKELIIKILNCFETGKPETDFSSIFIYRDGPNKTRQLTLGRGYVESGSLWDVFIKYKELGGKNADSLLSRRSEKGKETLPDNKEYINLIISSAKEESFRKAQDQVFDILYWNKGLDYFNKYGFTLPLSLAVIQDSILHSGSILKFLVNKFDEKKPSDGGSEKVWIKSYIEARQTWLTNHSKLLANTAYRTKFFLKEIEKGNWNLDKLPIYPNGIKIS